MARTPTGAADELRAELYGILRDELGMDVTLQGKRLVIRDGGAVTVILVTAATAERLAREVAT